MTDRELLDTYVQTGSDAAFRTLVERHVHLVYSVARRHLTSGQGAEDVTQAVYIELARHGRRIPTGMPVVAWLHVVARRTAIDHVRRETRRREREHRAAELALAMDKPELEWMAIAPVLDEAVETLRPDDRTAILLRFFENKSLRDVGSALGVSDDAAQKRISRALEQLRTFFERRGIAVTAATLATQLPSHALTLAPAGFTAGLSAHAIGAAASTTTHLARAFAMTTLHKTVLVSALALAVAGAGYEWHQIHEQRQTLVGLQAYVQATTHKAARLGADEAVDRKALQAAQAALDARLKAAQPAPLDPTEEQQMRLWLARLDQLKQTARARADLSGPELRLLTDTAWFRLAASGENLDDESGLANAFAQLRQQANTVLAAHLANALAMYRKANAGAFPPTPLALAAYDPDLTDEILAQYEIIPSWRSSVRSPENTGPVIVRRSPVDAERDNYIWVGARGNGSMPATFANALLAELAYQQANTGATPAKTEALVAYLKWPAYGPNQTRALSNVLAEAHP